MIQLILVLIVVGLLLPLLPIDQTIKNAIIVIIVAFVLLWALGMMMPHSWGFR